MVKKLIFYNNYRINYFNYLRFCIIININKKEKDPGTCDRLPLNSTDMHYTGDRVL